ncbi:hypothetical protein SY88_06490 [Clostridiales bacterium PH28_bin88]|nr:hypothetical protein SY88_06490 [Clostridiales bacterium PH28_bin88]
MKKILSVFEQADSINLGTGENGLNPDFGKIIEFLFSNGKKVSLTTNGYTVALLSEEELKQFNDIDISVEFPNAMEQNQFRGAGAWELATSAIARCKELGLNISIATCLMNINLHAIPQLIDFVRYWDVNLRLNIYKPVHSREFELTYDQFWMAIDTLFEHSKLVSCNEPVINAVLGEIDVGCSCGGKSLRVRPDGSLVPCVYWNKAAINIKTDQGITEEVIREKFSTLSVYSVPEACMDCPHMPACKGGCIGRRLYHNLYEPDPYCPFLRGQKKKLSVSRVPQKDLVHAGYLCTIIVEAP